MFEFRHESWYTDEVYKLLSDHGAALCVADSPKYPRRRSPQPTLYIFVFTDALGSCASDYSKAELGEEAKKMRRLLKEGQDVYAYFNNELKAMRSRMPETLTAMVKVVGE